MKLEAGLLLAGAAVALAGCPVPPVVPDLRTLRVEDLSNDPKVLEEQAEALEKAGDPVSLENCLAVREKQRRLDPSAFDPAWKAARAAFWLADDAMGDSSKARRAKFAQQGVDFGRQAMVLDPARVEGNYYYAINLGLLASTKTLGARGLLHDILDRGKKAAAAGETFDHCGPHRLLGQVYVKAPPWPASVGDVEEGRDHAARSVALCPDYLGNHLYYCDALLANDQRTEARRECQAVLDAAPVADWARLQPRWRAEAERLLQRINR